jgi:hypothetical protein
MESKELMEKLFGTRTPYPGMEVEWECFAGKDAMESGIYKGHIARVSFCQHCGLPTITATTEYDATYTIRFSETEQRWVCGKDAPK